MTLVAIRDAVVSTLRTQIPESDVPTIVAHDGAFGRKGSEFQTARDVAVFVTLLGVQDVDLDMPPGMLIEFAAHVFTRRAKDAPVTRGDVGMAVCEALMTVIATQRWGQSCKAAESIRAENLYSDDLADRGVTLWIVSWRQRFQLESVLTPEAALDDLRRIVATYDLVPSTPETVPAQDHISLEAPP